jgi:hypothetical protein
MKLDLMQQQLPAGSGEPETARTDTWTTTTITIAEPSKAVANL